MSDILVQRYAGTKDVLPVRYKDMRDGSMAPVGAVTLFPTRAWMTHQIINLSGAATNAVIAGSVGSFYGVHRMRLRTNGAGVIQLLSGTNVLERFEFAGPGGVVYDFSSEPWYTTASGDNFSLSSSTAVQVDGVLEYMTVTP